MANSLAWLQLLSPWLWPSIFSMLCFLVAMSRRVSAFVFYPLGILFSMYSLWMLRPVFPTLVLRCLSYDYLFFILALALGVFYLAIGLMSYRSLRQAESWGLLLLIFLSSLLVLAAANLLLLFIALEMFFLLSVLWVSFFHQGGQVSAMPVRLFLTGAFASAFTLFGMSFLYGVGASLSIADIGYWAGRSTSFVYGYGLMLFLAGILFKLSAVPFHHWTAEVYEDSPPPMLGLLAAVSKLMGVAVLIKIFYHFPIPRDILAVLAALSMLVGNLGALVQTRVKRLLAFSSIAHVGFLLMGFASGSVSGFQAVLTYMLYYGLSVLALLALLMLLRSGDGELTDYDGLAQRHPGLAALLSFLLLSLAGLPPTVGFLAKWKIIEASFQVGQYWLVGVAVLSSVIGAAYYATWVFRLFAKTGGAAFWQEEKNLPIFVLTLALFLILALSSLFPQALLDLGPLVTGGML